MSNKYSGSFVALITPFKDQAIDEKKFQELVEWQISQGTDGLVPCGTTGESPTLTHEEHERIIDLTLEVANGRVPVIAGTGSNSTQEAIRLTLHAEKAGADAALVVMPYYNKPTQAGMYSHFKALNDSTNMPIFIYNIPGRSVVDMSVETMAALAKLPNIVGVKDASNDPTRPTNLKISLNGLDFIQFSGEDPSQLGFMAAGGDGIISVTANVAPKLCSEFQKLTLNKGNNTSLENAKKINEKLSPLHKSLFVESSPSPVKYAASLLNLCSDDVRLPLVKITEETKKIVKSAMKYANLI